MFRPVLLCAASLSLLLTTSVHAQGIPAYSEGRTDTPASTIEKTVNPKAKEELVELMTPQAPSHPEKILIDYQKMADVEPDYVHLASISPFLRNTKPMDADAIKMREENRLRRVYAEADPKNDIIVVHTELPLNQYSTISETLLLPQFSSTTFFRFAAYDKNIALVPKDIDKFAKLEISKQKMNEIIGVTNGGAVRAELFLRPIAADGREPLREGNVDYWLLMGEVAEIRFWSQTANPQVVWFYRAPWYKPQQDKKLLDLFAVDVK